VTAAIIPFPNPAPAVPGQGSDPGTASRPETAEAGVANHDACPFAQLIDAIIGGNSLFYNEWSSSQGDVASAADRPEGAGSDHAEDPASQSARPDLAVAATVLLPTPVPIQMSGIELGRVTGPDLGMDEAESSNAGAGATGFDPIAASVGHSDSTPWPVVSAGGGRSALNKDELVAGGLAAETSLMAQTPEVEFAGTLNTARQELDKTGAPAKPFSSNSTDFTGAIPVPDAAEPSGRRPSSAQSLAFALRLTGTDKSVKTASSASRVGSRVAEASGASEAAGDIAEPNQPEASLPVGAVTRTASRTSGALARSIVGSIPTASVQTATGNAGAETADAATDSFKAAARTNPDQEAGPRQAAGRAADETGAARRESEQPTATVRSMTTSVATTITASIPTPQAGAASRPSHTGPSDAAAAARTQSAEHVERTLGENTASRTARDILVQIPVQDGHKVEIQVAERAGEVRVAVRTADLELNQSLRTELSSLVSRLETAGYKADSFAPSDSFLSSSSAARQDPSNSQQDAYRGFSGQGQGSSGQGGNRERRQESESMPWAEQFASHLSPDGETVKESQLWQSTSSR
jgi:hypothetical protein